MESYAETPDPVAGDAIAMPRYLAEHYWWAYSRSWAVKIFDHQPIVNLLLYGHYAKLRDAALAEFAGRLSGRSLQISCCYGDLTPRLAAGVAREGGRLDVVDVLPLQLENAARKIADPSAAHFHCMDAEALQFPDRAFDNVLLFFLLHEVPDATRAAAVKEALRVLKPDGAIVIVEFGRPVRWHPLRFFWLPLLGLLEPFAVALWRGALEDVLAPHNRTWREESYFGGLFRKRVSRGPAVGSER